MEGGNLVRKTKVMNECFAPNRAVGPWRDQGAGIEREDGFEPLLDAGEAAGLLRIHPKTLQRLTRLGHVPGYRVGRYWRYRRSDLEIWLRSGTNANGQPADRVDLTMERIP